MPVAITLVTVPLYLEAIGIERYGVLALIWVLVGYFAFFDFGIGRATAQRMARLSGDDAPSRNRLFWTSFSLTLALACLAGLLSWPIAKILIPRLEVAHRLQAELALSLPLIVMAVPVGIVQSVINGALEGRRAFGPINAVMVVGNALTALLPLFFAWLFTPEIPTLIAGTLLARLVVLSAQALLCKRLIPLSAPTRPKVEEISGLLRFGGWVTVSGIAGPLLVYFDRFAIGAWIGGAALGFYVIGFNLVAQLQLLPAALARSIFPRLSELGEDEAVGRSNDAICAVAGVITPVAAIACVAARPFLELWLGSAVAEQAAPVTVLLLVGFWANALAQVPLVRLHSAGRPDLSAKVHLLELGPYAAALWTGISLIRLSGAAIAWSLRTIADLVALYLLAQLSKLLIPALLVHFLIVLSTAVLVLLTPTMPWLMILSLSFCVIAAFAGWVMFPSHLRHRLAAVLGRSKPPLS